MTAIAIDFGTSRTKLAYLKDGRAELMRFERDLPYVPSLFYLPAGSDEILWGYDAEAMLDEDPAGVIDTPKRKLLQTHVWANGRKEAPVRLLTRMFADLRAQAGAHVAALNGKAPEKVQLTIPVLYGPTDERRMREAATAAGFSEVDVVAEPVAAARAWLAETKAQADDVIVFDAGGGTIDWAWLRCEGGEFRVVPECPPGGDTRVGGHDLDLEILELVRHQLLAQGDGEAAAAIEARPARFVAAARVLKESLARGTPAPVRIKGRTVRIEPAQVGEVLNARFISQACEHLSGYLAKVRARRPGARPTILLVGGSGRLKGLKEAIETHVGCPTAWWERSEFATVLGGVGGDSDTFRDELVRIPVSPALMSKVACATKAKITSICFSPDGRSLASIGEDGTLRLWNIQTGQCEVTVGGWDKVQFSPDGRYVYCGEYDIMAIEVDKGFIIKDTYIENCYDFAVCPKTGVIICGSNNSEPIASLWTPGCERKIGEIKGKYGEFPSISLSNDGKQLVCGTSKPDELSLWDIGSGQCLERVALRRSCWGVVFGQRDWIACFDVRNVVVYQVSRGDLTRAWSNSWPDEFVGRHVGAFSPRDDLFVCGGPEGILWYRASNGEALAERELPSVLGGVHNTTRAVAFSPSGSLVASGGDDGVLRLWDARTCRCLREMVGHGVWSAKSIMISADGKAAAVATKDTDSSTLKRSSDGSSQAILIDLGRCSTLAAVDSLSDPDEAIEAVALSCDMTQMASIARWREGIEIQYIRTPRLDGNPYVTPLTEPDANWLGVNVLKYSPCGKWIVIGHKNGLCVFELGTGKCVFSVQEKEPDHLRCSALAFSHDGTLFAADLFSMVSDHRKSQCNVWRVDGWQQIMSVTYREGIRDYSDHQLVFLNSGRCLCRFSARGDINVWDIPSGKMRVNKENENAATRALTVLADGRLAIVGDTVSDFSLLV